MRIAFIVNNYPPRVGGVEMHVHSLAKELLSLGHKVLVVTLGESVGRSIYKGVDVLTLPEHFRIADTLGFPSPGTRRRLMNMLRSEEVDIVSTHTRFFPMSYIGMRAAKRTGIPVIHTEHGSNYVTSDSPLISLASRIVDHSFGRAVLRGADRVLGVSEPVVAFVRRLSGAEASVFYNAIAAPNTSPRDQPNRTHRFVFVGRLVPGKGWEVFLETLAELSRAGFRVEGRLAGDGPDAGAAQSMIRALGLTNQVIALGRVSQSEVRALLRGATLMNPTILSEGFQTTLLEAVAEGGRVITYPVPGAETLTRNGAPVFSTVHQSPEELGALTLSIAEEPWTPMSDQQLQPWTWKARGEDYARICSSFVNH